MNAVLLPYFFNTIVHASLSLFNFINKISHSFEFIHDMFIAVVYDYEWLDILYGIPYLLAINKLRPFTFTILKEHILESHNFCHTMTKPSIKIKKTSGRFFHSKNGSFKRVFPERAIVISAAYQRMFNIRISRLS